MIIGVRCELSTAALVFVLAVFRLVFAFVVFFALIVVVAFLVFFGFFLIGVTAKTLGVVVFVEVLTGFFLLGPAKVVTAVAKINVAYLLVTGLFD